MKAKTTWIIGDPHQFTLRGKKEKKEKGKRFLGLPFLFISMDFSMANILSHLVGS